jgi:ABC-2 type transport system ATP-binding protein
VTNPPAGGVRGSWWGVGSTPRPGRINRLVDAASLRVGDVRTAVPRDACRMAAIEIEGMVRRFGTVTAVDGLSLTVQSGEVVGLVGPNGAGKSTTVECLLGLQAPDEGLVRVLGLDPVRSRAELQRRVGAQLQDAALQDRLKVWEALDLFATFHGRRDWTPLLADWGLETRRDAAFGELSGGERQRLFVALALLHEPELLVLDEVTTGLDPQARRDVLDLIAGLPARGVTVLLVTHALEDAARLCDRVAVLVGGRLAALDTPAALQGSGSLEDAYLELTR